MTNDEMLTAIKAMFVAERKITDAKFMAVQKSTDAKFEAIDAKIEAAQKETIQQIKTLLENGVEKQIQLLAEGHAQILARLPDASKQAELEERVTTLEHVAADHTRQIGELRQMRQA